MIYVNNMLVIYNREYDYIKNQFNYNSKEIYYHVLYLILLIPLLYQLTWELAKGGVPRRD